MATPVRKHLFTARLDRDSASTEAVLTLAGEIWPDNSNASAMIAERLANVQPGEPLTVLIRNLYGGDVDEGMTIYHDLKVFKPTVKVDGVCASMGSIIMLAGSSIEASAHSKIMTHRPKGGVSGDFEDMRERASLNEGRYNEMAAIYAERLKVTPEEAAVLLMPKGRNEWMSARQAQGRGLVDKVTPGSLLRGTVALKELRGETDPERIMDRFTAMLEEDEVTTNNDTMNKELAKRLGLPETASEQEIIATLDSAINDRDSYAKRLNDLAAADTARKEKELAELLDGAVKADAMKMAERDELLAAAKGNMDVALATARTLVKNLKPHVPASAQLGRDAGMASKMADRADKDYNWWAENDPAGLAKMRDTDRASYDKLLSERPSTRK